MAFIRVGLESYAYLKLQGYSKGLRLKKGKRINELSAFLIFQLDINENLYLV